MWSLMKPNNFEILQPNSKSVFNNFPQNFPIRADNEMNTSFQEMVYGADC